MGMVVIHASERYAVCVGCKEVRQGVCDADWLALHAAHDHPSSTAPQPAPVRAARWWTRRGQAVRRVTGGRDTASTDRPDTAGTDRPDTVPPR